jgi:signal transduction histidine kinase
MLLIVITILCAIIASLVALFTLVRNSSSAVHRWLFMLIFMASVWVLSVNLHSVVDWDLGIWLLRIAFLAAAILGFSMLQFSTALCGIKRRAYSRFSLWLLAIAGAVLSLSPSVINGFKGYTEGGAIEPDRGVLYPVLLVIILYFITHAIFVIERRRRKEHGARRSQLLIVQLSLLAGTVVGVFTNIVLPNITQTTYPSRFAFIAIIILTAGLLYAVVQHRFLDIRLAVARTAAYALTFGIVILLYALVVFTVTRFFFGDLAQNEVAYQTTSIIVAALLAVTFQPMRVFFDKLTNRIFFRDAYDTKQVLDMVSDSLVEEVATEPLVNKVGRIVGHATKAGYFEAILIQKRDATWSKRISVGKHDAEIGSIVKILQGSSQHIATVDDLRGGNDELREELVKADVAIAVRLQTSKEQVGYLLVGYKANGAAYTQQDVDLVRIAGDELAVALQNAMRFEEIEGFNVTLREEVKEATAELRSSNSKLRKLDEAKDEFISMASHQLRTPLTGVKGYLSMALEGDAGKLNEQQKKLIEEAFMSAQRMVYLIGDFLNVSRIQTGKFVLEPRPINMAVLVQEEINQLLTVAQRRNITLEYHQPANFPILNVDEDKMRQVVMNFTDNAIYYSKPGSTVNIELIVTATAVELRVRDTGIGVPEAERHHLFTKFYRAANARQTRPDGTGVGLFMAKKVITAHGGSIIFESQMGKGSTFGFSMPLKALAVPEGKIEQPKQQLENKVEQLKQQPANNQHAAADHGK